MEVAPQNPAGYSQMGTLRFSAKAVEGSEKYYAQALQLEPNSAGALAGVTNLYLVRKEESG